MNTLIQLEVLRTLKKLGRRSQSSSGSDDEEGPFGRKRHVEKGLNKVRKRISQEPERVVEEYVASVKDRLGITDRRQVWHPRDYSRRLSARFGRLKSLWRCHLMTSEILALKLGGRHAEATAHICQLQKILVQVACDQGSWENGVLLWPSPDPMGSEDMGGMPDEMKEIFLYKKAVGELKAKHRRPEADEQEPDDKHEEHGRRRHAKGKAKAAAGKE
jgi:hypothetical protein